MVGTRLRARRVLALVVALAVSVVTLGQAVAHAATNPAIRVGVTSMVKSDANGNTSPDAWIRVGEVAMLSFSWNASDPTIQAGDSFEIEYAPYFRARVPNQSYPILFRGALIGTCVTATTKVVCTLNQEYETQRAGSPDVSGTGSILLQALQQTTDETVPMQVNGQTVPVDLPGTGGIRAPSTAVFTPATFSKVATPLSEASTSLAWSVTFNIDYVNTQRVAAGLAPIPTDGTTISSLTIHDVLGPGQTIPEEVALVRVTRTSPGVREALASIKRGTIVPGHSVAMVADTATATSDVTITAPFLSDTNYTFGYQAPIVAADGTPQKAIPGIRYSNTATVPGTTMRAYSERTLTESFGITVNLDPGFGGFKAVKSVGGAGSHLVAAGTRFPVTATYTLPAGRTVDSYPGWTAPGTVNADRTGGTFTYDVVMGANSPWNGQLPTGTSVTLTEDPAASTPATVGVEWGTPVFRIGNATRSTFTVGDRTFVNLSLENTTTLAWGTFTVAKTVSGEGGAGVTKDYTFSYDCAGVTGTVTAKGDGVPVAGVRVPLNASCTVTEDAASAQIDGHTLAVPAAQTLAVTSTTTPTAFTFSNVYTRDLGTFAVSKTSTGADTATKTFVFDYDCAGTTGSMNVPGDGTAVPSNVQVPTGTACTVTERADSAQLDGYTLTAPAPQTVTVTTTPATLAFTNAYTRDTGVVQVVKTSTGADTTATTFAFTYTCTDGAQGRVEARGDGVPVALTGRVPTGTSCTLTEDVATAAIPGYSVQTSGPLTVTVSAKDETVTASFVNVYTRLADASASPTPSPSPRTPSQPGVRLPGTGSAVGPMAALAAVSLLAAGGVLVLRGRRR